MYIMSCRVIYAFKVVIRDGSIISVQPNQYGGEVINEW